MEIKKCHELEDGLGSLQITTGKLKNAMEKLKRGKGSPDVCTAEMFLMLPDHALDALAMYFTSIFSSLNTPASWTEL